MKQSRDAGARVPILARDHHVAPQALLVISIFYCFFKHFSNLRAPIGARSFDSSFYFSMKYKKTSADFSADAVQIVKDIHKRFSKSCTSWKHRPGICRWSSRRTLLTKFPQSSCSCHSRYPYYCQPRIFCIHSRHSCIHIRTDNRCALCRLGEWYCWTVSDHSIFRKDNLLNTRCFRSICWNLGSILR